MNLQIDQHRLATELDQLGAISQEPAPAVTRIVFTEDDLRGRTFVQNLCREAGLEIRVDAVGNTFARWPGTDPTLAPVGTGSHIDALPNAGRFDGPVGVLGALEAIRALQKAGYQPRRGIEILTFTSEEPTRFGIGCLGSRLISGLLDPGKADQMTGRDGLTLEQARTQAGFTGPLASTQLPSGCYHAFVELHIEQGPLLEQRNLPIGIVTAIAAPAGLKIDIEGEGGHAGAVRMPTRHDAFLAGAEIALAVETAVLATGAIDTVGTVGVCEVFPGAVNSVPSRTRLEVDVRDIDEARRNRVLEKIDHAIKEIATRRSVTITTQLVNADPPATCSPLVVDALTTACETHKLPYDRMISRAYHDSLFMSRIAPTAMLFIPCHKGYSHRPDEYSSPEAIATGALILAHALATLSE